MNGRRASTRRQKLAEWKKPDLSVIAGGTLASGFGGPRGGPANGLLGIVGKCLDVKYFGSLSPALGTRSNEGFES